MRALRAAALAFLLGAAFPAIVSAHAQLLSSTPVADATISSLPASFLLVYDDDLRGDSSFVVIGPAGLTVATGAVDPTSVKTMIAPMPALPDGSYEVRWTAISNDDGFIERGSFKFEVALATPAPSDSPSTAGSPLASPAPTAASPGATGTGSGAPSPITGDVLIPIIAVAVLIGVGLTWFLRRRGPG